MHVALAMKKKVVAIFGPTNYRENYLYDIGSAFYPQDFHCDKFPCQLGRCIHFDDSCISLIKPELVSMKVHEMMQAESLFEV
jgi:heptosyltransferase-2